MEKIADRMVKFDSTSFGSVTIDGKRYSDVLVIEGKVMPRKRDLLRKVFGTSHKISEDEAGQLLKGAPQVVIIGSGQSGVLEVDESIRKELSQKAELIILQTPGAIKKFNELACLGKKVNALIHTTC